MHRRLLRSPGPETVRRASWLLIAGVAIGWIVTMVIRGPAAGADAEVYWTAARVWLAGGDPYDLPDRVLPYVYAPWGMPLFAPWSLLPWPVAFALWRSVIIVALAWTIWWAARRRPAATAATVVTLSVPIGINLDTGNLTLPLTLVIFGSRFGPSWVAGVTWGAATGLKWATLPLGIILSRSARRWGLATLALAGVLSIATLPMTIDQLRTITSLDRPFPFDYLALGWAAVPWLWTDPERRQWVRPRAWVRYIGSHVPAVESREGAGRRSHRRERPESGRSDPAPPRDSTARVDSG